MNNILDPEFVSEYLKQLESQLEDKLISEDEFNQSLRSLGITTEEDSDPIIIRPYDAEIDQDHLFKFHDLFYREVLGGPKCDKDSKNDICNIQRIVAESKGKIIGLAEFAFNPIDYKGQSIKGASFLDKIIVPRNKRLHRVGAHLLERVLEESYREKGLNRLSLDAPSSAFSFYNKCGFIGSDKYEGDLRRFNLPFDYETLEEVGEYVMNNSLTDSGITRTTGISLNKRVSFEENPFFKKLRKLTEDKSKFEFIY